jgi:peptidoglycan hydrolase CwlO-like protein
LTKIVICTLLAVAVAASCSAKDNSADTDRASEDLREAQSAVTAKHSDVTTTGDEIERRKRDLVAAQQQLADKEKSLDNSRRQLGSAQGTLTDARAAYSAAVKERFAKLNAGLAGLATRTEVASKDASAGLAARRDLLATRLAQMPGGADASWAAYTKDVDTAFDAIERDLRAATP